MAIMTALSKDNVDASGRKSCCAPARGQYVSSTSTFLPCLTLVFIPRLTFVYEHASFFYVYKGGYSKSEHVCTRGDLFSIHTSGDVHRPLRLPL